MFWNDYNTNDDNPKTEYFLSLTDTYFDLFYQIQKIVDKDKILKEKREQWKIIE